jgi:hypothetical protein
MRLILYFIISSIYSDSGITGIIVSRCDVTMEVRYSNEKGTFAHLIYVSMKIQASAHISIKQLR